MRLLWARVGIPYSPATGLPIAAQTVSQMVDRVMALPEGTRALPARPGRARPQGRVSQGARRVAEGRLHPRPHRRRDLRDRGSPRARQEVQARHRGGGRPPRGARGHRDAAGRQLRDRRSSSPRGWPMSIWPTASSRAARTRRSRRRDEGRRHPRQPHRLLREVRLPGLRLHHRRDRAAPVLASTPRRAPARPATASARSCCSTEDLVVPNDALSIKKGAVVPWAKSNPPSPYYMQVLGSLAREFGFEPRHAVAATCPARSSAIILHGTEGKPVTLTFIDGRKSYDVQQAVRGRDRQPQPPPAPDRERVDARGAEQVPDRRSPARSATARASSPRRSRSRSPARTSPRHAPLGGRRARLVHRRCPSQLTDQQNADRRAHPQGDRRAARLPQQCRARLPQPRPHQRHAVAAARASASASPARSAAGLSGVLYVLDEPSSASTSATTTCCSRRSSACAISATP